jgi:ketosteroid isomerase-like protein
LRRSSFATGLILLGAFALAAGSCGGDAEEEFIAEAESICAESLAEEPPQIHNVDTDREATVAILGEKVAVVERRRERLSELEAPEEHSGRWDQFLDNEQERVELANEQVELIEEGDGVADVIARLRDLTAEQYELAQEIGFETCGHGRYAQGGPEPDVALDERLGELERVIEAEDCDGLVAISSTELMLANPGSFCRTVFNQLEGFDARDAEVDDFGTAAIVEHDGPEGMISQPLVLDGDETFRLTAVYQNRESVGEQPPAGAEFDEVANDAIERIREGDCEGIERFYDPEAFESAEDACGVFTGRLTTTLEADPEAAPEQLGANAWFAAYALRTAQGGYTTLLVSRRDADDIEAERGGRYRLSVAAAPFR